MNDRERGSIQALETYRPYLECIARQQPLDGRLRAKVDLSDIVNTTLFEAHQQQDKVRGRSPRDIRAWLRRILTNNLVDAVRRFRTSRRDVSLEVLIETGVEQSSVRLADLVAAQHTSPSKAAARKEDDVRVAEALSRLPEGQRTAVEYHHLQGLSLEETATRMGRTNDAVAGLIYRGLKNLRANLSEKG